MNPIYLEEMKRAAREIGPMMDHSMPLVGRLKNGWIIPPANTGNAGADYMSRAVVAVFGLTANTPIQAVYYPGPLDGNDEPLTGEKRYEITFKGAMDYAQPVPPGFWSVTMYDAVTRLDRSQSDQPVHARERQYLQEKPGWVLHDLRAT